MGHVMRKRGIITAIVISLLAGVLSAQEISHVVLVPAAGVVTAGSVDLSQTIGETAVILFTGTDYDLTQGFQQPRIIFTDGPQPQGKGANVYPNPVSDILTIEVFGNTGMTFDISIVNMYGSVIYTTSLEFNDSFWYKLQHPVDDLASGLYMVKVASRDRLVKRIFKIEKL